MPNPKMTADEMAAYQVALERIEVCRKIGKDGIQLDLSGLGLSDLPPELGQLTTLTQLHLFGNQLTSLPPELGQLTTLTQLHLFGNQLTSLPPELGQLTALRQLLLFNNQLTSLPSELGQLTALTLLALSNNQLTSLPPELGQLTALTLLDLSNNQLTSLPPELGQLTALTLLTLSNNQLTSLPPELGQLTALRRLILQGNILQQLPESLVRLVKLEELTLHENEALGLPSEILGPKHVALGADNSPAKPSEILHHYFAQRRGQQRPLNEVKVLVVGESEVGKTSLIRQLQGERYNPREDKTHGIERHRWSMDCGKLGSVRLNLWDFGGQDIMHATHQFFFTQRSVYLLVLDSRQNERQSRIDYWLRLIASYGGDSPVIVVCNKADQQVMQLNWTGWQRDFPQIKAYVKELCCFHVAGEDRRRGLADLKHQLARVVEKEVAEVDRPILTSWLNFKEELEQDGRAYLSLEEYHQMARERGMQDEQDRTLLLTLLHRLGSVLHFSEHAIFERELHEDGPPAQVEELNVLEPGWVTEAIYKLLNDPALIRNGGVMTRKGLRRALAELPGQRYPASKEDFIVAMMRRFEICFPFDGEGDRWFLPDLLHKEEVDTGEWGGALGFRYKYKVLPGSVIGRLIVRLHHYLARHCLWRTGAKLRLENCEALIRGEPEDGRIDLLIRGGTARERREVLSLIRGTLEGIHGSFSNRLGVVELVPIPGCPGAFIGYKKLLLLEQRGSSASQEEVDGRLVEVEVQEALNGVAELAKREEERDSLWRKESRKDGTKADGPSIYVSGDLIYRGDKSVTHDQRIHIGGDVTNSQVGQTLTHCANLIQQVPAGERQELLKKLENEVRKLVKALPAEKQEEAAGNLELLVKAVTGTKANRAWYEVSAKGLLEAAKFVKDFSGVIGGVVKNLGKSVWTDFALPGEE